MTSLERMYFLSNILPETTTMRELNYLELRSYVLSEAMDLDINPLVFNHPSLMHMDASAIDYTIKQELFNGNFNKISDTSYNPKYKEELQSNTKIYCRMVLKPKNKYHDIRDLDGFKKSWYRLLNWWNMNPQLVIEPRSIGIIVFNIRIIENSRIPEVQFVPNLDLIMKGLKVLSTHVSVNNISDTYSVVYNDSSERIVIDDLSNVGSIRIINSDYIHM